jgi:NADPH:quinone reductase-like Zn-dependent oxidoreductase
MRQVWIPRVGPPAVLEVREAPDPEPVAGEVRIRVAASGINFADCLARMGLYPDAPKPPVVVGYEVAGEVDRVGPGVDQVTVGERVVAVTRFGGYSDVVTVPAAQVLSIPPNVSVEKAAALPVNYLTAWIMLVWLGNLHPGERVLVHAVAGGVGQAAVQICRWRGGTVIGTASASKHPRLKESGVAHCIDYTTQDFETEIQRITDGQGVDIVLDAVGGRSFTKSYRCLGPLGRLFVFGASSFAPRTTRIRNAPAAVRGFLSLPSYRPISLMNDNRGVFGVNLGHLFDRGELLARMLRDIMRLTADEEFTPVVDRIFPFDRAAEAHAYIQRRKNFGKVLLAP